ncbi:hypothetical protein HDV04_000009 [Boothiomyces sp. JEL0838]|nr:hypothetical protein HDV04_000009 [Boothiomyces sp. JEL0838]
MELSSTNLAAMKIPDDGWPTYTSETQSEDASKPWLIYWIFHSLDLLSSPVDLDLKKRALETLNSCQNVDGGYSGGRGQISHLATTYAAVNAIAIIGTTDAYESVDRKALYSFLMRVKQPDGSFKMHEDGEVDIRGSYCAVNVAVLLNMMTPELIEGVPEFIAKCQTYEGGLGSFPNVEAHGGYTYCGLAALTFLDRVHLLDVDAILDWTLARQMQCEGGFQGRVNKLVDGCYSFWQGGACALLELHLSKTKVRLQEYTLVCCQSENGGLRDKPGKSPDYYHTCYCLSGLSICQNQFKYVQGELVIEESSDILSKETNMLKKIHPVHNICIDKVDAIMQHFYK